MNKQPLFSFLFDWAAAIVLTYLVVSTKSTEVACFVVAVVSASIMAKTARVVYKSPKIPDRYPLLDVLLGAVCVAFVANAGFAVLAWLLVIATAVDLLEEPMPGEANAK